MFDIRVMTTVELKDTMDTYSNSNFGGNLDLQSRDHKRIRVNGLQPPVPCVFPSNLVQSPYDVTLLWGVVLGMILGSVEGATEPFLLVAR